MVVFIKSIDAIKVKKFSSKAINIGLVFSLLVILLLSFQFSIYRQHAFKVTGFYALEFLGITSNQNLFAHGEICVNLHRDRCSVRIFRKLLNKIPNSPEVLAKLAISLSRMQRSEEALPYFKAYWSVGGQDANAKYWYADSLETLGRIAESIPWLYQVVAVQIENNSAVQRLFSSLTQLGRIEEAKIFQSMYLGHCERTKSCSSEVTFLPKTSSDSRSIASVNSEDDDVVQPLYFPSIDGRYFYLPLTDVSKALNTEVSITYVSDRSKSAVSMTDLEKWKLSWRPTSTNTVIIDKLRIAGTLFTNKSVELTESGPSELGNDFFGNQIARIDNRQEMSFLVLNKTPDTK